jgi:hypothetical protein
MRSGPVVVLAVAAGLLMPRPLVAHHSSAAFDSGKRVILKGTVKEWVYTNPHCFLMLEVRGEDGQNVQWVAETQPPSVIFAAGYRRDTFKPGDQVTVTVEPVKDGRPFGRILATVLPDGKTLGPASSAGAVGPQP